MKTVYKVVRIVNGEYRSTLYGLHGEFALTYRHNERTTARRGTLGVFVFLDLIDARRFRDNEGGKFDCGYSFGIFECDGFGQPKRVFNLSCNRFAYLFAHFRRLQLIDRFRDLVRARHGGQVQLMSAPSGTYTVESVIPRRIVV